MVNNREIGARAIVLYGSDKVEGPHAVRGMGMKFTHIREADVDVIRTFIKERVVRDLQGCRD